MPIVKIYGGLGNQLFQYSFAYVADKKLNEGIVLDLSQFTQAEWPVFNLFNLKISAQKTISFNEKNYFHRQLSKICRRIKFIKYNFFKEETPFSFYDRNQIIRNKTYYDGYFSNYKYFDDYRNELINLYVPNFEFDSKSLELLKQIENSNSVAVHFRRGDYVKIGCTINNNYYKKAIDLLENKNENYTYFVFSNDLDFAKKAIMECSNNIKIVPIEIEDGKYKDMIEFFLMKNCKNHIIANSTYSWWAAYLANHDDKVIAPEVKQWNKDFYPTEWKIISTEYEIKGENL